MKTGDSKNKTERVMVNIRIRPFNEDEKKRDPSCPIDAIDLKRNSFQSNFNSFINIHQLYIYIYNYMNYFYIHSQKGV
jgi:hypothetical protein